MTLRATILTILVGAGIVLTSLSALDAYYCASGTYTVLPPEGERGACKIYKPGTPSWLRGTTPMMEVLP